MNGKIGRNYRLDIFTPSGEQITISYPFTIEINIVRNTLASANTGNFVIYNLKESTRNRIYKDRYSTTEYWRVRLLAGYGNRLYEVFTGNALEAMSSKDGTDWKTELQCFDGMDAIQNGFTNTTIQKETPKANMLEGIIRDMPNLVKGLFGSEAEGEAPRGKVLLGQSSEILNQETDGQYFIDKETINILTDDEVIPGDVIVLDSEQLLSSPKRRETFLDVETLFEPAVQIGHVYEINSMIPIYNGQYKIMGFTHAGTISGSVNSTMTTSLQLYFGAGGLQEV